MTVDHICEVCGIALKEPNPEHPHICDACAEDARITRAELKGDDNERRAPS